MLRPRGQRAVNGDRRAMRTSVRAGHFATMAPGSINAQRKDFRHI